MNHAFVNGDILPAAKATLPVADRAVRFGDGVFETMRLNRGIPYLWDYHMERLEQGMQALHITAPAWNIRDACHSLLKKDKPEQGTLRIAVSRGAGSEGYLPTGKTSSLIIEILPSNPVHGPQKLWLAGIRRISPVMLPSSAKLSQGVASTLAMLEAQRHGHDNALMLSIEGYVSECTNANLFWLKDGIIHTPSLSTGCVAGTTRRRLMELTPITESEAPYADLLDAESIAISNTRLGLHPIASISSGEGSLAFRIDGFSQLSDLLQADCARYTDTHMEQWH